MSCDTYAGRDFRLVGQFTDGAYGTVPTTTDALRLKFSQLSLNRNPTRQNDPTINENVLDSKESEVDETPEGSITTVACLQDALFWFRGVFGAPVTTGSSAPFSHAFTLTNDCRPDFLLDLVGQRIASPTPDPRIRRFLGAMVKDFAWDMLSDEQNFTMNLLAARSVRPFPVAAFDSTPRKFTRDRALAARGQVYDVSGANTLGYVAGATLNINLDPQARKLADGLFGYGMVQPGQIQITGTVSVLYADGGLSDYGDLQTTRPMTLKTTGEAGGTFTMVMPSVEFSEPSNEVQTKQGIVRQHNWRAHFTEGDAAVTATLVNGYAGLVTP